MLQSLAVHLFSVTAAAGVLAAACRNLLESRGSVLGVAGGKPGSFTDGDAATIGWMEAGGGEVSTEFTAQRVEKS